MNKLDVNPTDMPHAEIRNEEQAQNFVDDLVRQMTMWRNACDVPIPDKDNKAALEQRRAMWSFLTKQGQVVGALKAFKLCGLISERCYKEFHQKAINALIPTNVGGE
jgi:hypothetical protein